MKFMLEIELGNDQMKSPTDLAKALQRTAVVIKESYLQYRVITTRDSSKILDVNGNSVGKWAVMNDDDQHDEIIALLWGMLPKSEGHTDRVDTGVGNKTKVGLVSTVKRAVFGGN